MCDIGIGISLPKLIQYGLIARFSRQAHVAGRHASRRGTHQGTPPMGWCTGNMRHRVGAGTGEERGYRLARTR